MVLRTAAVLNLPALFGGLDPCMSVPSSPGPLLLPAAPHLTSPTIFKLLVGETSCTGLGGEAGEELDEKELWAAPRTSEGRRRLTPHLAGGQPRREQSQSIPAQNPGLGTLISNAFHDDS